MTLRAVYDHISRLLAEILAFIEITCREMIRSCFVLAQTEAWRLTLRTVRDSGLIHRSLAQGSATRISVVGTATQVEPAPGARVKDTFALSTSLNSAMPMTTSLYPAADEYALRSMSEVPDRRATYDAPVQFGKAFATSRIARGSPRRS